jgi:hypothetical protein
MMAIKENAVQKVSQSCVLYPYLFGQVVMMGKMTFSNIVQCSKEKMRTLNYRALEFTLRNNNSQDHS